jgi:beta-galactosidase
MFQMKKYWEDPAILHINREPARSTYIPYGDADASKNGARQRGACAPSWVA